MMALDGWLRNIEFWNELSFKKLFGESGAEYTSSATEWKEESLKLLLSEYAAGDVFNSHETSLFYQISKENIAFEGDKCIVGKKAN